MDTNLPIRQIVIGGKVVVVLFMVFYAIFAYILTKRVSLMNKNLTTPQSSLFKIIAKAHMIVSVIVIILAIINL